MFIQVYSFTFIVPFKSSFLELAFVVVVVFLFIFGFCIILRFAFFIVCRELEFVFSASKHSIHSPLLFRWFVWYFRPVCLIPFFSFVKYVHRDMAHTEERVLFTQESTWISFAEKRDKPTTNSPSYILCSFFIINSVIGCHWIRYIPRNSFIIMEEKRIFFLRAMAEWKKIERNYRIFGHSGAKNIPITSTVSKIGKK